MGVGMNSPKEVKSGVPECENFGHFDSKLFCSNI